MNDHALWWAWKGAKVAFLLGIVAYLLIVVVQHHPPTNDGVIIMQETPAYYRRVA